MKKMRTEWFTARAGLLLSASTLLMAVNPAAAQFDPNDPLIVPGRVVAAVLNDRIITDIERDIKAITGLTPSVSEKNHPYIDFKFSLPSDNDAREALRDVFETADSSGQLKWWDGVAVIDAARMDVAKLRAFFEEELSRCEKEGLMASLHLKATMMKVSDPIMFGHAVEVYFKVRR